MNSLKIKLIASQSRSKKVQVGEKMKSVPTHYKASLPDQFNSEDQDWVDAMNRVLPENEKIELDKNNIELACLHTIVLLILTIVITPALIALASQFIPYPEMPF